MKNFFELVEKFLQENGLPANRYASCPLDKLVKIRPYDSSLKKLATLRDKAEEKGFAVKITEPDHEHPDIKELIFTKDSSDWVKLRENYPEYFFLDSATAQLDDCEFQERYEG